MVLREKLGRLLKPYRLDMVATAAGVHVATLHNILKGKGARVETVRALAQALGVEFTWLVDDVKPWPPVRTDERGIDRLAESAAA